VEEREREREGDGESRDVDIRRSAPSGDSEEQRLERMRERALSGSSFRLGLVGGRRRGGGAARLKERKTKKETS
jgi:hypothetical protein